jgi:hypothetical protein
VSLAIHSTHSTDRDEALIADLRRPSEQGNGWGLLRTLVLGTISFGTLPLLDWSIRTRELFAGEAARLVQVCRYAAPDPTWPLRLGLMRQARRTGPIAMFWLLPTLIAAFLMGGAVVVMLSAKYNGIGHLIDLTYGAGTEATFDDPRSLLQTAFGIWSALLIGGYLVHLLHVQIHFASVRRFLVRFNGVLAMSGVRTIPLPRVSILPGLLWAAGGIILTTWGAWWALPMVLAGSIQRRDAFDMHRNLRTTLADRMAELSKVHIRIEPRCQTPRCQTVLRPAARFCPRCGTAVHPLFAEKELWA